MADKIKILIIDDEEDFCHFVKLNLEITNEFEVFTSVDGTEVVRLPKRKGPDLILLDVMMPKMGGSEVAESLLSDPLTRDIPIIFVTALVQKSEEKDKSALIGGHMFISKPVVSNELIGRIKLVLGRE